jgi:dehydrogenase/reductase SDR family member 1
VGDLDGRVAVVIGATRGIGKGIARELADAGAVVYVAGRTLEPMEGRVGSLVETVAAIEDAGGEAVAVRCDVGDDASIAGLFERVRAERGQLDVLVNSAFDSFTFRATLGVPYWELPVTLWDDVVDLGTRSAYAACVHATPLLLQSEHGLIVNVSGRGAGRYRYNVAYGVGKAALDRMTADMAVDLEASAVTVVSVWPGTIRTEHLDAMIERGDEWALTTLGDVDAMETPRYVGRCVAALAADPDARARTGRHWWIAELGAAYAVVDEHGRPHDLPE